MDRRGVLRPRAQTPPSAPTGLTATAISSTQIDLSWNDVSSETGYRVERSANGSNAWSEIAILNQNQQTYSDLQVRSQQTYFYRVRALNNGGFSPYSNIANATTPSPPPPNAADVILWAGQASVKIGAWSSVADSSAAGGVRMSNPDSGAAKLSSALANPPSYFEMTFTAQSGIDYRLWMRGKAQADYWGNDSVFVQFSDSVASNGSATYRIGTTSAAEYNLEDCSGCGIQGWGWQDNGWGTGVLGPLLRFQSSGSHTVRIQVREDGLSIDQIVLSPQTFLNSSPGSLRNDQTILPKSNGSVPPPAITSVTPSSGSTSGGTVINISGSGFSTGATVSLGGTAATNVTVNNSNSITATTAAHSAGAVNVVVTNTDGQTGNLANGYTYVAPPPPPTVTGINPSSGTTAGGTSITISGTGFQSGASVSLGGTAATNISVVNSTSITAVTAAHAAGVVNVTVTNPGGQAGTLSNGFTYVAPPPPPTVGSVTPNVGTTAGGTAISISGSNFVSGATVSLGGSTASNVAVVNSSLITAITSAHAAGTVNVVVTNPDGQSGSLSNGFTYTAPPQPVPSFGHVVVVVAENQSYESVIGSPAMPYLNTLANRYGLASNYYANTHPSIGNYFWLTTGQGVTNDSNFSGTVSVDNIVRQFLLSGKTWKSYAESIPSVGYMGPDQYPYVRRHNPFSYFSDVLDDAVQANNIVPFSQFAADAASNQLPHFSFLIPNQYNNAHDCPPSNPNCTNAYKLAAADNWLRLNLDSLLANASFRNDGLLIIVFDESVNTDTANGGGHIPMLVISAKTKQGFSSSSLYQHQSTLRMMTEALGVTSPPGAAANAANMAEFFGTSPNTAPIISTISPTSGATAGGTSITISGSGFSNEAGVSFGGTPASVVSVVGSTTITVVAPAHSSGPVNVVVTNPNGESSTKTNGFTYVAPVPPPVVNSVTPNSGTTAGGTSVTISGNQFSANASVDIAGLAATSVVVVNSTTITANTPAHAPGTFDLVVRNSDGQTATLNGGYTFITPTETILLTDDFNNGVLDPAKWDRDNLWSGFTDASITVTETQSLDIGSLKQGVGGSHYNGISSVVSYNFTGAYAYTQIVQSPNANTAADAFFTIGRDVDNCYRMYVESGSLIVQSKLQGAKKTLFTLSFNANNHAFWRIRHDVASGNVIFEVAPAVGTAPGSWQQIYSETWNTGAVPLSTVRFELKAGTWRAENTAPGTVKFDNFKAAKP